MPKSSVLTPTIAKGSNTTWWKETATPVQGQHKILKTIPFKLSNFDDENRTFTAIASTGVVDRQGDSIVQEGWDVTNFMLNPVIPWAHDYGQPPVARAIEIGVTDGVLTFTYQAPPKGMYDFADTIWEFYRNQFMFAFSVGFIPTELDGSPLENWSWEGNTFERCELLEISAVVVPANPQALALSYKMGKIDAKQAKQLLAKLQTASEALKEAVEEDLEKVAEKTTELGISQDALERAVDLALTRFSELHGIELNSKTLTADERSLDNNTMKVKQSTKSMDLAQCKAMCDSIGEVATTLSAHAKALDGHASTMSAHSQMVQTKADMLVKAADYLKSQLLLPTDDGDETTAKPEGDLMRSEEGAKTKDVSEEAVKEVTEEAPVVEATEEPTEEVKEEVVAEPVVEEPASDIEEVKEDTTEAEAEEVKEDAEPAEGSEDNSGEVKSEETPTDGADHNDLSDDSEVDPDNLSDEQVEEVLRSVNAELKKEQTD